MTKVGDDAVPGENEVIKVGQRVHCTLYGGKDGVIYAIHGEQAPGSCRRMGGGMMVTGGRALFDIVWEGGGASPRTSEAVVRSGVQWRLLPGIAGPEEIADLLDKHERHVASVKEAAEREAQIFRDDVARLIRENPHLKPVEPGVYSGAKFCAANIRIELKKAFPGVKFSVKSERGAVYVRWEDGPTSRQVEKITSRYQHGDFDGMEDIYRHSKSPWNSAFGGTDYVFESRDLSNELKEKMLDFLYRALPGNFEGIERESAEEMMRGCRSDVPGLSRSVSELVRDLASGWNAVSKAFELDEGYHHARWLIESVVRAESQAAEAETTDVEQLASAPGM